MLRYGRAISIVLIAIGLLVSPVASSPASAHTGGDSGTVASWGSSQQDDDDGNGSWWLDSDDDEDDGNGSWWFDSDDDEDDGNGSRWLDSDDDEDDGNGSRWFDPNDDSCMMTSFFSTCDPDEDYDRIDCSRLFGQSECVDGDVRGCEGRYGQTGCDNAGLVYQVKVTCSNIKEVGGKILADCSGSQNAKADLSDCLEPSVNSMSSGSGTYYCKAPLEPSDGSSLNAVGIVDMSSASQSRGQVAAYCTEETSWRPADCDPVGAQSVDFETCELYSRERQSLTLLGAWYVCQRD